MTTHSDLLPTYRRLRQASLALNTRLVHSLDSDALFECAQRLGMTQGETMIFETEDETNVLMDYALHDDWRGGQNAVGRYLARSRPASGSDDERLLEALAEARHSLFEVIASEPGVGVTIVDGIFGGTDFLIDIGLSRSAPIGGFLAARVFSPGGFAMSTGAALPLNVDALRELKEADHNKFNYVESEFRNLTRPQRSELTTLIIRSCLRAGASRRVAYVDPGAPVPQRPAMQAKLGKIGRNDRCPCGSGKKFKHCCGILG